jgi:hypothetical protein
VAVGVENRTLVAYIESVHRRLTLKLRLHILWRSFLPWASPFSSYALCAALATYAFRVTPGFAGRRGVTGSTRASITTAFAVALSAVTFVTIDAAIGIAIALFVVASATVSTIRWQPSITRRLHLLLAGCSFAPTPEITAALAAAAGLASAILPTPCTPGLRFYLQIMWDQFLSPKALKKHSPTRCTAISGVKHALKKFVGSMRSIELGTW